MKGTDWLKARPMRMVAAVWIATRVAVFATPLIYVAVLLDVWRIRCNFLARFTIFLSRASVSRAYEFRP